MASIASGWGRAAARAASLARRAASAAHAMTEITLQFLRDLLSSDYPDVTILKFEGVPGTNRGDNYTSMVYRVTLKGVKRVPGETSSQDTTEPWEGSIIYKCLPESILRREAFKSDELFCNEVAFYNKIWPAFNRFQSQWEEVKYPFKAVPKCYLAQNDLVILKDLKPFGFVMPDRRQGLTIEQGYYVLKQLAQFHALSLAMKCEDPETFFELLNVQDGLSEVFFVTENQDYYKTYYKEAMHNALDMVEEELQGDDDKDFYLEKFRKFCSPKTFFQMMVDQVVPQEPLAVICHGDFWTNNMLFRHVDAEIAEMCIVDFQLARYTSPALDLVYVAYVCLDQEQRADHLPSLLEYYVDELHERLLQITDVDSVFNTSLHRDALFESVQDEFRRMGKFALGIALDMFPITTCDSTEAPNLYQAQSPQESEAAEAGGRSVERSEPPVRTHNAACRRKMVALVKELVDQEIV